MRRLISAKKTRGNMVTIKVDDIYWGKLILVYFREVDDCMAVFQGGGYTKKDGFNAYGLYAFYRRMIVHFLKESIFPTLYRDISKVSDYPRDVVKSASCVTSIIIENHMPCLIDNHISEVKSLMNMEDSYCRSMFPNTETRSTPISHILRGRSLLGRTYPPRFGLIRPIYPIHM